MVQFANQDIPDPLDDQSNNYIKPRLIAKSTCNSINTINLKETRGLLSCASYGTILTGSKEVSALFLADSGSGLGFISLPFVKLHKLPQVGNWTGLIETLQGDMHGTFPLYQTQILDNLSQVSSAKLIGVESIGYKDAIPNVIFNDMCKQFKLDQNLVMNCNGPYDILLGIDNVLLHPDKNLQLRCSKYSEAVVMSTPLAESFFFMGAIGAPLAEGKTRTSAFYAGARGESNSKEVNAVSPLWNLLNKTSQKVGAFKCFLSNIFTSRVDSDAQVPDLTPGPSNWAELAAIPGESNEVYSNLNEPDAPLLKTSTSEQLNPCHMRLCSSHKALLKSRDHTKCMVAFQTRRSAATIDMELASPPPALACQPCQLQIASCPTCRYMNSNMSIKEMQELTLMRNAIVVTDLPDGTKSVMVSYLQKTDPHKIFCPTNSNHAAAAASSKRLRNNLIKIGQLHNFHAQMQKTLDDGHARACNSDPSTDCPSNFILLNFQMKDSKSQPIRPVSNSSFANKSGRSLNSETISGPSWLGSGLECVLNFRYGTYGYCADISRFYRSVKTCEITNALRKYYWFSDPDDPSSLTTYQFIVANYGDAPISLYCEIIVQDIIANNCKTPELTYAAKHNRLVDDVVSSANSLETVLAIKQDMVATFSSYNFNVKHFLHTSQKFEDDVDQSTSVLGMNWDIARDSITCKTVIFPKAKKRGKHVSDPLSKESIQTLCIDREFLARASGVLFDYAGVMLGPIQAAVRVAYSKVCSLTREWNVPCHVLDPVLDNNIRNLLLTLTDLPNDIQPFPRCLTLPNHTPEKLVICGDASESGLGFCYYIISKSNKGTSISNICLARTSVHKLTVAMAELDSLVRAVKMIPEYLKMVPQLTKLPRLAIIICTDSLAMASALNPSKPQKDVRPRNACISIHRVLTEIVQQHPTITVSMTHTEGTKNPSDSLTRLTSDPVSLVNEAKYRHGMPKWSQQDWPPEQAIFLLFRHGKPTRFTKPIAEQALTATISPDEHAVSHTDCHRTATKLVNPEAELITPGRDMLKTLDDKIYKRLLSNCSNIYKVIGAIATMLEKLGMSTNSNLHGRPRHFLEELALKIILRTHQRIYGPPKNIKLTRPWVDNDGLVRVTTRLDAEAGVILDTSTTPIIINHADTRLVELLILQSHLCPSGNLSKIHIGSRLTTANMRKLGYWLPRQTELVNKFIANCKVCNFVNKNPQSPELGSPRWVKMLRSNHIIWRFISCDEIGPFIKKTHPNSRTTVKYWILCLLDVCTSAVNYEVMEDRSRSSVHKALFNHVQTYGMPSHCWTDAGTSIAPDPSSSDYRKYFEKSMSITQYLPGHQVLSQVERYIQMGKKILKTVLLQRDRLSMPNLSYTDVRVLLNATKGVLNSKPLFRDDATDIIITPNHLIHPYFVVEKGSELASTLDKAEEYSKSTILLKSLEPFTQSLAKLSSALELKNHYFTSMLKTLFVSDNRKILQAGKKTSFKAQDIVLVFKTVDYNLGVITTPGDQCSEVLTSSSTPPKVVKVHNSKLVLLYRHHKPGNDQPSDGNADNQPSTSCRVSKPISKHNHHSMILAPLGNFGEPGRFSFPLNF